MLRRAALVPPYGAEGAAYYHHSGQIKVSPTRWGLTYPVGPVRGHGSGEDDAPLAPQLDEHARRGRGAVPPAEHVELIQPLDLLQAEIQRRLVLGRAGVGHHAVEAALPGDDGLERGLDALLACHVALLKLELAGVALEQGGVVLARLGDVEVEDAGRVVGQADLRDAQPDALVGAGD